MRKFLSLIFLLTTLLSSKVTAQSVSNENLSYDVMFKWGLIEAKAGEVSLITEIDSVADMFSSMLVGRSTSIADKIYSVRDTLSGRIMRSTIEPVYYEKIAHEAGAFRRDVLNYNRDGQGNVSATASVQKINKKGVEENGEKLMTATGITLDMLSAFYYMRYVDYDSLKPGDSLVFNIFSGKKKELLRITYIDKTKVDVKAFGNMPFEVYHVSFTFTYDDKEQKKSSDPIQAWIGTDENRIPYIVTGKLPIGGIRCILSSSNVNP